MKYSEFLKENYEILQIIFNQMRIGVWITDGTGKVLMVNDDSMKAGGLRREQIIGRTMEELVSVGYINEAAAQDAIRSGKEEAVIEGLGEGGFCFSTSVPLRYEGEIDLVITIERDISDFVSLQNALKEQEKVTKQIREQLMKAKIDLPDDSDDLVAVSYKMIRVRETAEHIGAIGVNTVLLGESGTGKELISELIYKSSRRVEKPFVKVNCAAIPESLIESELFGYEPGAFTGASKEGHRGYFENADGGTLFLDEIGELPLPVQSKLLRVLEYGEVRRIGSEKVQHVDVRVIAATNRDLKKCVEEGTFRKDLYYRIMVMPIIIPPLRERKEDVIPLARSFLRKFNRKYIMNKEFSHSAEEELLAYSWPGNVRELKNVIERLAVSSEGNVISGFLARRCIHGSASFEITDTAELPGGRKETLSEMVQKFEIEVIREYIDQYGSMSAAAAHLGVNKSTISRKLKDASAGKLQA